VELEDIFQHRFGFLVRRVIEVHPEDQAFIGADEAKRFDLQVASDQLTLIENERVDHGREASREGSVAKPSDLN
jgi:hypothetical protein